MSEEKKTELNLKNIPDHIAHYYNGEQYEQYPYNVIGLGLNEALLRQTKQMAFQADVILNLSERVGKKPLLQLFHENGYEPEIIYQEIVPHCDITNLSFFASLEYALLELKHIPDFECSFFCDSQGKQQISARKALQRREQQPQDPLYHRLLVIKGRPK